MLVEKTNSKKIQINLNPSHIFSDGISKKYFVVFAEIYELFQRHTKGQQGYDME
jgi:hypothetical protein